MTDDSPRRLILVRHGVTDWNREGRWQGRLDPSLSDTGRSEARMVAARIASDTDLRPARVLSSTLGRASETGRVIAEAVGVRVEPEPRLMEIGAGEWEGRTHAELETTARIKRDTLRGLLDEMTNGTPRPRRKRSYSQVAALLPPIGSDPSSPT